MSAQAKQHCVAGSMLIGPVLGAKSIARFSRNSIQTFFWRSKVIVALCNIQT
jgi:hypothetical protein